MIPMTYAQWRATEEKGEDSASLRRRYEAYRAAVVFIRSQVGDLPHTPRPTSLDVGPFVHAAR